MQPNDKYHCVGLTLLILLVGLHLAVAAKGYQFVKQYDQIDLELFNQRGSFLIVSASLTFFIAIALLVDIFYKFLSPKIKNALATILLVLQFSIAVTISIFISQQSILIQYYLDKYNFDPLNQDKKFKIFYQLGMADTVITFVLEVVYAAILYCKTIDDVLEPPPDHSSPSQGPPQTSHHPQPPPIGYITTSPNNLSLMNNQNSPYIQMKMN